MKYTRLGRTDLQVSRTSFGALPIQRTEAKEVTRIIHKAIDSGINFFDTARFYTDSECKLGCALKGKRDKVIIATKSMAVNKAQFLNELETSLKELNTDYIDIMQLHNPRELPDQDDPNSAIAALDSAKKAGLIRFSGLTNHSRDVVVQGLNTGIFDTIQFPLSMIAGAEDWEIAKKCRDLDVGVIAMKAMAGGMITNAKAAFAYMRQFDYVVPIWGIQQMSELEEFLSFEENEPVLDAELRALIKKDTEELAGNFCRGCGYCLPCPAAIDIPWAARMGYLVKRMPFEPLITPLWRDKMRKIADCINCGLCKSRCPYGLNTPELLRKMQKEYNTFISDIESKL